MEISTIINNIDKFDNEKFSIKEIGVEIQSFPQDKLDKGYNDLIKLWQNKLLDYDKVISLHGSSFDLHPGSTDKRIVEVTKFRYLQSVDIAKKLKAKYLVFHSQINPLLSVKKIRDLKLNNQISFWNDLLENDIPSDLCILIENEYDENCEDIKKICDGIHKPNFGVCLDIGHVLAYSKETIEDWISNLGDRIKYIHLHWNDTSSDDHNKPTNKELKFLKQLLSKYSLSPVITLEYHSKDIYKEVKRVRKYL